MYIEFKLPTGAGGMTALHASKYILKRMREWAELHNIKITSEHTGYRMAFMLENPRDYTLFVLSWQTDSSRWVNYTIVNDEDC